MKSQVDARILQTCCFHKSLVPPALGFLVPSCSERTASVKIQGSVNVLLLAERSYAGQPDIYEWSLFHSFIINWGESARLLGNSWAISSVSLTVAADSAVSVSLEVLDSASSTSEDPGGVARISGAEGGTGTSTWYKKQEQLTSYKKIWHVPILSVHPHFKLPASPLSQLDASSQIFNSKAASGCTYPKAFQTFGLLNGVALFAQCLKGILTFWVFTSCCSNQKLLHTVTLFFKSPTLIPNVRTTGF